MIRIYRFLPILFIVVLSLVPVQDRYTFADDVSGSRLGKQGIEDKDERDRIGELEKSDASGMEAYKRGDWDAMARAFRRSAGLCEEIYGRDHAETATRYSNLGSAYDRKGDPDRAIVWYEKAREIEEKIYSRDKYPDGHPDLATTYSNLGSAYNRKGDPDRAIVWLREGPGDRGKDIQP